MASADQVLSEFIDDWNAGRRPRAEAYLARVDPSEEDALADGIAAWMEVAPTPAYDDAARAALRAEPAVRGAQDAFGGPAGLWPSLLPRLRARSRLSLDAVARGVASALGFQAREDKVRRYLGEMEQGSLDAHGVSGRVLDALAGVLGATADELRRAGAAGPAAAPAGAAFFRATAPEVVELQDLAIVADAMLASGPAEWDEVDAAFLGG